jgi:hypothetical protein
MLSNVIIGPSAVVDFSGEAEVLELFIFLAEPS